MSLRTLSRHNSRHDGSQSVTPSGFLVILSIDGTTSRVECFLEGRPSLVLRSHTTYTCPYHLRVFCLSGWFWWSQRIFRGQRLHTSGGSEKNPWRVRSGGNPTVVEEGPVEGTHPTRPVRWYPLPHTHNCSISGVKTKKSFRPIVTHDVNFVGSLSLFALIRLKSVQLRKSICTSSST